MGFPEQTWIAGLEEPLKYGKEPYNYRDQPDYQNAGAAIWN